MRKLIFVGLKVAELCGLIVFTWLLTLWGRLHLSWGLMTDYDVTAEWYIVLMAGVIFALLEIMILGLLAFGVRYMIKRNWEWAERIGGKK